MKKLSILLVLLFLCGCGGGAAVKGTVKFDDGTPLTQGTVKFIGDATQAIGPIKSDGTYRLGETKAGDGVTPGRYKVVVDATTGGGSDGKPLTHLVDPKFAEASTSDLACEVKGGMTYDITVTKP